MCPNGHKEERFVKNSEVHTVECGECGLEANRMICSPSFKLPGNDPHGFPTAYQKWGDDHVRRAKEAAKNNPENDS